MSSYGKSAKGQQPNQRKPRKPINAVEEHQALFQRINHAVGGKITGIAPTARDPQRMNIKVNGKFILALHTKRIADLNLQKDLEWTPALAQSVADAAVYDKALMRAMNRLSRRAMSRRTLDQKLKMIGYTDTVRDQVLDRLEELRLLDDEAYARAVVHQLSLGKPAGPKLLKQKLWQKGLDTKTIDAVLNETDLTTDTQREQAQQLVEKKLPSLERYDHPTRYRRLQGLLARRGFDHDIIRDVLSQLNRHDDAETDL